MIMMNLIVMLLICWVCMFRWPLLILVFSLPATCVFFVVGLATENFEVVLISPGLFLSCYIYVGLFMAGEDHQRARVIARQVLATVLMLLFVVLIGFLFGPVVMAGILVFVVWMVAMIAYGRTARRSLLFSVLSTLKTSMKQNLPLPMALECAAQGLASQESLVYRQLKKHLIMGHDLVEALRLAMPRCPGHVTGVLQGAQRMGNLVSGLEAVHKNVTLRDKRKQACEPVDPAYPIIVLMFMAVIGSALFRYVIPQFVTVIREISNGDMPVITQWLIWFWRVGSGPLQVAVGIVLGAWAIGTLIGWLRRGQRPNWLINITDWFRWHLPFIHRFDRIFGLIQLLETLSLCLNAGSPVDQAVSECENLDVNRCFRRKIRRWHRAIVKGQSVSEA
ncbi:MAG: hypothetical protein K9N55_11465, partial [Phycisphaerae bacterium]|nr:hypothetical protein [Phycisphaerae bacterium]